MRVWLVQIAEPLPIDDDGNARLLRTGMFADYLVKSGHEVVWWTSDFDHRKKTKRHGYDRTVEIQNGYSINLISGLPYRKNISLKRLLDHSLIAFKFSMWAREEQKPDIIVASFPAIEISASAVRYGLNNKVPVVVDVRDLWPDLFFDLVPSHLKWLMKSLLVTKVHATRFALSKATAITSITEEFLEWGLNYAQRHRSPLDKVIPFGYLAKPPEAHQIASANAVWDKYDQLNGQEKFIICFFGTIGKQFDLESVIDAAAKLESDNGNFYFVICGDGDALDHYEKYSKKCESVVFPGWRTQAEIWTLLQRADIGIAPYLESENFLKNLPNKIIEYFSAGLPVVSSLNGVIGGLLSKHDCGIVYRQRDSDSLVTCLKMLKSDKKNLAEMSRNARSLYVDKFSIEKIFPPAIKQLELIVRENHTH